MFLILYITWRILILQSPCNCEGTELVYFQAPWIAHSFGTWIATISRSFGARPRSQSVDECPWNWGVHTRSSSHKLRSIQTGREPISPVHVRKQGSYYLHWAGSKPFYVGKVCKVRFCIFYTRDFFLLRWFLRVVRTVRPEVSNTWLYCLASSTTGIYGLTPTLIYWGSVPSMSRDVI